MEFIDFQYQLRNLKDHHCEAIKRILCTHQSVAFFTDTIATRKDLLKVISHVEGDRSNLYDLTAAHVSARSKMLGDFNICAQKVPMLQRELPLQRMIMSLHAATGFRLYKRVAIVILYLSSDLGRYEQIIDQAAARHGHVDEHVSVYRICYGDTNA